ncbi:MAG TPA: hypothetical protein VHV52_03640 [Gaiellaceae bacterium]|nr:hypothetical protein [Gaiellaceae bacterium]
MGTPAAPRIDVRLRRYISGAPFFASPAEVTREVGDLAWQLGLPRPSYQQVRELLGGAHRPEAVPVAAQTSRGHIVLRAIGTGYDFMAQYPGPGLEDWYRRYKRGLV